jgi:FkbM family methyltransferase
MKIKFELLKSFPKVFTRFFKSLYKHKLDYNLAELINKGLDIKVIYDIGAYHGEWSKSLNETSLKKKDFILFEANQTNIEYLKKSKFKYFIGVLSNEKKKINFYSRKLTGDSYYREQSERYDNNYKPEVITTITLDEIIEKENLKLPNLIKIDTQGSEIDILKGALKATNHCDLIYLETPIIEYNLNSPSLNECVDYLRSIDFVPFDICEVHYMDKILIQIDILYIKKSKFFEIFPGGKSIDFLN